jgi:leucyl aminopeptidase
MNYKNETALLWQAKSDVLVVGVFLNEEVEAALKSVDTSLEKDGSAFLGKIVAAVKEESFTGKSGQTLTLPTYGEAACKRVVLVGLGKKQDFNSSGTRKMAGNMARRLMANEKIGSCCFVLREGGGTNGADPAAKGGNGQNSKSAAKTEDQGQHLKALVEGWVLGSFAFQKYKTSNKEEKRAEVAEIAVRGWNGKDEDFHLICNVGETIGNATNFARGLIAEPACYMTPSRLAEEAEAIGKEFGLQCSILDAEQARALGMGSFLGVARGAKEPARFVTLKYEAPGAKKTVAIVGKGITFDSGGLSLKPALPMEHMKYDMSGAAAVLGIMKVVGSLKPRVSVLGVLAATENMPGDNALHPGDVLTAMNGKTIEVNNTDAEGRLVLADALTYACQQGADELIDIATLTGAIVTAIGRAAAGIMGTSQNLIDGLIQAGSEAGEKYWQMPLYDEYKEALKSDIADLKNAGSRGEAGSSAAGMFLKEFVDGKPWAHLDIAGPAWLEKDKDENNKGGTAFGVRTLSRYLLNGDA